MRVSWSFTDLDNKNSCTKSTARNFRISMEIFCQVFNCCPLCFIFNGNLSKPLVKYHTGPSIRQWNFYVVSDAGTLFPASLLSVDLYVINTGINFLPGSEFFFLLVPVNIFLIISCMFSETLNHCILLQTGLS